MGRPIRPSEAPFICDLSGSDMRVAPVANNHVFAYVRHQTAPTANQRILVLNNFTEQAQSVASDEVRLYGLGHTCRDLISEQPIGVQEDDLTLEPYGMLWLVVDGL